MTDPMKQAGKAAQGAARQTADAARQTADAAQNAAHEGSRRMRAMTDEALETGQDAARAGADAARMSAEAAQQAIQSSMEVAYKFAQRSTDQFMHIFGFSGHPGNELAQQSSQNVEALTNTGNVLARGFQDLSREWFNFTQSRFDKNLDRLGALANCRSFSDVLAVQSELMRENWEEMIDKSRRLMEMSAEVTREAARTITSQTR